MTSSTRKIAALMLTLSMSGLGHAQATRQLIKPADSTSITATAGPSIVIPALPSNVCTSTNGNCYSRNNPGSSTGNLGNRMGYFSVNPSQTGYVRASTCLLSQVSGNTNRNTSYVRPIAGPFSDGTYVWNIGSSGSVEDPTSATCYFNGTAGVFNSAAFPNYDNNSAGPVVNDISGYYVRTYQDYYHLDFLKGESQFAGRTYLTDYTYAPCTVDPASSACAAQVPICPAPTVYDAFNRACIDPNANTGGG